MRYIARALKDLNLNWRSEFSNLSQTESIVFLAVASNPGIDSADIQDELDLDQPHASRILKKLLSKRVIRSLTLRRSDRKKAYFLEPKEGSARFLIWIDCVLDKLLVRNPAMLGRFIAALEDAPEDVIENLLQGIMQVRNKRALAEQTSKSMPCYCLSRRNRSDHFYRKLFIQ